MKAAEALLNEVLNFLSMCQIKSFLNYKIYFSKNEKEFLRNSYLIPIGLTYDDGLKRNLQTELEKVRKILILQKHLLKSGMKKFQSIQCLKYTKRKSPQSSRTKLSFFQSS